MPRGAKVSWEQVSIVLCETGGCDRPSVLWLGRVSGGGTRRQPRLGGINSTLTYLLYLLLTNL